MPTKKLTKEIFKEVFFDYTTEKEWNYKAKVPAIVDFYADWCGPCKMVAPILEELSDEYEGKVDIYKCDTEVEQELAGVFGIKSIPTMLFVPTMDKGKQPMMQAGALMKPQLIQIIEKELLETVKAD